MMALCILHTNLTNCIEWMLRMISISVTSKATIAYIPFPSQSVPSTGIIPTLSDAIIPKDTRKSSIIPYSEGP